MSTQGWCCVRSFAELLAAAKARGPRTLAVAAAADREVLAAVDMAHREGLCRAALVGDASRIAALAGELGVDLGPHRVVDEPDAERAAVRAVELVAMGEADFLMKGMLPTAALLRAVLDKERGLRTGQMLSHVGLLEVPGFGRLLGITDFVMNVAPDLKAKAAILRNALEVLRRIGLSEPRVAVLAAVEVVNPEMPATLDGALLSKMAERGEFGPCHVDGPLAMDLAVSEEAARHKGVGGPVAGRADLLLVPDLNAGNILYKALVYLAGARVAGVVVGARAPVVLISRADTAENKLYSIALGLIAS